MKTETYEKERFSIGLYLHVPFCSKTCDFCAFYQVKPTRDVIERYLDGIETELSLIGQFDSLNTIFWGGGTPGLLSAKDMEGLGKTVGKFVGETAEWSVEMAPGSIKEDKLMVLKDLGVTRISMGVQSFNDVFLDGLGRQHSTKQIYRAYELLQKVGFKSVNLDLIFSIPGQTAEDWEADLKEAIRLEPDHISTYCLTFEEDTALYVKLSDGRVSVDEEKEVAFYRKSWDVLAAASYVQYEISNYAREGHECVHNINTWRMHEWIGVGPSASEQFRGWRSSNVADEAQWYQDLKEGRRSQSDRILLEDRLLFEDALIFGLRMNAGVQLNELEERFPGVPVASLSPFFENLLKEGKMIKGSSGNLCLSDEGRLVADAIGSELLNCFEEKIGHSE